MAVGTYAFREVGVGEVTVAGEAIKVGLDVPPGVAGLVAADGSEAAERPVRAGASAVELRALPARGRAVCADSMPDDGGAWWAFIAVVAAAEPLGHVLRELSRMHHDLHLELLGEL